MHIQVVSKGIDVSDALRARVEERLADAVGKFSRRPAEAFVVITKERFAFNVECSVHLPSGAMLQAHGEADDAYVAAENALDRLEKRLRRYKRKRSDHRGANGASAEAEAPLVVLRGLERIETNNGDDDDSDEAALAAALAADAFEPVVVAETTAEIPTLTPGMAVFELELAHAPVLVFRNAVHGGVNVVYRRPDGHFGWIDPGRAGRRAAP